MINQEVLNNDLNAIKWIETKHKLPKPNAKALAFSPCSIGSESGAVLIQKGWACKHEQVTHWMPIPKEPTKGWK